MEERSVLLQDAECFVFLTQRHREGQSALSYFYHLSFHQATNAIAETFPGLEIKRWAKKTLIFFISAQLAKKSGGLSWDGLPPPIRSGLGPMFSEPVQRRWWSFRLSATSAPEGRKPRQPTPCRWSRAHSGRFPGCQKERITKEPAQSNFQDPPPSLLLPRESIQPSPAGVDRQAKPFSQFQLCFSQAQQGHCEGRRGSL